MLNESLLITPIWPELLLRLGVATLVGMALGYDREVSDHPAGIRTHGLIALGASLVTVSAILLTTQMDPEFRRMDLLRIFEAMATAAAIIGAGLIVVRGGNVRNLTSAAHVWLTSVIGIACGAGQYAIVIIGSVLGLFVIFVVKRMKPAVTPEND